MSGVGSLMCMSSPPPHKELLIGVMFVFVFVINPKSNEQHLAFSAPCLLFPRRANVCVKKCVGVVLC